MKKTASILALAIGVFGSQAVLASTDYSWTTTGSSSTTGSYGNTRTFTASGTAVTLTASAFSSTGTGGTVQTAYLGAYGGGLGVTNRGEDGSQPGHATDNGSSGTLQDAILYNFSSAIELNTVKAGYYSNDSDLWVYRWVGSGTPPALLGNTWNTILTGGNWQKIGGPYLDVGDGTAATNNRAPAQITSAEGQSSSYWLIGTFGNVDGKADYVKLSMVAGCVGGTSGCGGSGGGGTVPEPGSLALVTLALGGMLGLRRRRAA